MSDDLIRRLREQHEGGGRYVALGLFAEAADRIEALEDALERERQNVMNHWQRQEDDAALLRQALAQMEGNMYALAAAAPRDDIEAYAAVIATLRERLGLRDE